MFLLEIKLFIKSPNNIEEKETKHEIVNKINLLILEIFIFLIPYVMPIPKESKLLDKASKIELINISKTSY